MKKILIIDDNKDFLELLEIALSKEYEITCAHYKVDILRLIAVESYDLIISDYHFADHKVDEIFRILENEKKLPKTPIIIISGSATLIPDDFTVPIAKILSKPFKIKELRKLAQEVLMAN